MIKIKEAKLIHNMLISRFGGIEGIRDEGALESALKRPYSIFDQIKDWISKRIII